MTRLLYEGKVRKATTKEHASVAAESHLSPELRVW